MTLKRFLLIAASSVLLQGTASAATQLGDIMPLGDSITDGQGASGGYRDPLAAALTAAGYTFHFVGSQTDNSTAALTSAGQDQHEGHPGFVIQSKDPTDPVGSGRDGILDNIDTWLGATNPSYILLMIGTNDIDLDYFRPNAPNRLDQLITRISNATTGLQPDAHLIVAKITPITNATKDGWAVEYNGAIEGVIANHQALGEHVSFVDMHSALQPADMTDNLHPNQSGYNKMANVWLAGIQVAAPEPEAAILLVAGGVLLFARRGHRRRG